VSWLLVMALLVLRLRAIFVAVLVPGLGNHRRCCNAGEK